MAVSQRDKCEICGMKNALTLLMAASLLIGCGRTENAKDKASSQSTTAATDSVVVAAPTPKNCRSIIEADKLDKPLEYKETAKPLKFTLTLNQDTSTTQTADGCYFNYTVTILATKKSGSQAFKRTLLKDDLLYFTKDDDAIRRSILQHATYKPTFTSERFFDLTMRLIEPTSKKTKDYTLFMNYHGEIVKVR